MKRSKIWRILILVFCLTVTLNLLGITTFPVKMKCPICGEENEFYEYASWGSYVYQWPSKFQMVFWPHTYSTSMYICKRCHYTTWMWDFKDARPEKTADLRKILSEFSDVPKFDKYGKVPMSVRLGIAERVYQTLGRDDEFWSHFYRVQGYYLALEKKTEAAKQARGKARDLLIQLAQDPKQAPHKKQFLVSLAAMQHFLSDDQAALETLAKAKKETFTDPEKDVHGYDQYLSQLIDEYIEKIKSHSVPADDQDESS